jgi:hypothetical protein
LATKKPDFDVAYDNKVLRVTANGPVIVSGNGRRRRLKKILDDEGPWEIEVWITSKGGSKKK